MLTIGELADKTGLPPSTIRYYEQAGVLPAPRRTDAGYRLYDTEDVARLELLQRGKLLGLTLAELAQLVQATHDGCCDAVDPVLDRLLRERLVDLDRRLSELQALRGTLDHTLNRLHPTGPAADADAAGLGCGGALCTTAGPASNIDSSHRR